MDSVSLNKNVIVDLLLSVGFAALGERYIRVWPCSKKPVDVDWPQKAKWSLTHPTIRNWYGNIGLVLGDGIVDVEYDHEDLRQIVNKLPKTLTWKSPARSEHRLLRCSLAHTIRLNVGKKHVGDIQSAGSMVLLPGCQHPNGGEYEIIDKLCNRSLSMLNSLTGLCLRQRISRR